MIRARLLVSLTLLSVSAQANPAIAILTKSGSSEIVRRSDMSQLKPGDGELLFEGDALMMPAGASVAAEFRVCSPAD